MLTKHKKAKANHRKKLIKRWTNEQRGSFRREHPDLKHVSKPKPLSKEDLMSQRKPIENEGAETQKSS